MKKREKLYYVETGLGVGIRSGVSKERVLKEELNSVGSWNGVKEVRIATQEDISWVKNMGGYIPQLTNA